MKKLKKITKQKKGFTLIEVLAVVAILGVLFGLGMYYFGNYNEEVNNKTLSLNNSSILTGAELYVKEHLNEIDWTNALGVGVNAKSVYIPVVQLINKGYLDESDIESNKDYCVLVVKTDDGMYSSEITLCQNDGKVLVRIPKAKDYCKTDEFYNGSEISLVEPTGDLNGGFIFENFFCIIQFIFQRHDTCPLGFKNK